MNYVDQIKELISENRGTLLTSDLEKKGIPRTYLSIMEQNGNIERVAWGVYVAKSMMEDELYVFQSRNKRAVFSHETALYLHGLTDRTPLAFSVTVPSGYHATRLKQNGCKVFFAKAGLYELGIISVNTPHGNSVRTFDLERTICDILRSRNRMDVQIINDAVRGYVKRKERDLTRLNKYADRFGLRKIVRQYIEVLL